MTKDLTTSEKIIAAAQQLIVAGGYNGFSYADIADVVGIRKASIHHHFPTKATLVHDLVVAYSAEADGGLGYIEQSSQTGRDALEGYAGFWARCIADASHPYCLCAMLGSEYPILPDEVAAEVRAFFAQLSAWVTRQMARGAADGSLRLTDPAGTEADAFIAAVYGAMLMARTLGEPGRFRTIIEPSLRRLAQP